MEDDITATGLEPGTFDAIVSFEVLEHVQDPRAAFTAMARLLRPGGIVYHDYNPFFAANGGHSLCTLDFPWGHARLDAADFKRYVADLRPDEFDQALRFYSESLNRMTRAELRDSIADAGLDLLHVLPWSDRALVRHLTPDVVAEVSRVHPRATIEDLITTFVVVVARRPHEPLTPRRSLDEGPVEARSARDVDSGPSTPNRRQVLRRESIPWADCPHALIREHLALAYVGDDVEGSSENDVREFRWPTLVTCASQGLPRHAAVADQGHQLIGFEGERSVRPTIRPPQREVLLDEAGPSATC